MTFQRRILVVEDDSFIGSLMCSALVLNDFDAHLADSAVAATRAIEKFDPDAVIVDIDLGDGPSGIELVRVVRKAHPHIATILLSKHADLESAGVSPESLPDGVAYLRKSLVHDTSELIGSINETLRGNSTQVRHDLQSKGKLDLLTKSQREILQLMALGLSNAEIARRRGVSDSAIEKRVSEIFKTFGISRENNVVPRVLAVRHYLAESGISSEAE